MKKGKALLLYKKYHIDRNDERLGMLTILKEKYKISKALYPGSFVHITPSFVFPKVVYVDTNKPAKDFFNDPSIHEFVSNKKFYDEEPAISFHHKDYRKDIGETKESFELLISQYAGFISQFCKKYLKIEGILLANSSHGDASMASIDTDYEFIGVLNKRRNKYSFSEKNLDSYFIPKKPRKITRVSGKSKKRNRLHEISNSISFQKKGVGNLFSKILETAFF